MRRIVMWLASTVAALVLLFTYRTSAGPSTVATVAEAPVAGGAGTYDGTLVDTDQGPVQVRITVVDGKITEVEAIEYPTGNRHHDQINEYALPRLREAALAAQSAEIDTVSGATDTSEGYIESLRAAIDAAHLAA